MTTKRNIYLQMKSLEAARRILFETFRERLTLPVKTVSVYDAVGRVLATPVSAKLSSPAFHVAAMDGIAVSAAVTFGAAETAPKQLTIGVEAMYVNTGHAMPRGTDAVIMIEHVNELEEGQVEIQAPAYPWQYVRRVGEDIVAGEQLFPRHHRITPYCIGALLAAGVGRVPVKRRPHVILIPTGSELIDWETAADGKMQPGQVIEANTHVLGNLVAANGGTYKRHPNVDDTVAGIRQAVEASVAADCDMILLTGGSSAGSEDYTRSVIEALGRVLVHGVTMMPGKPLLIGEIAGKPVFGMPGYPVSAILAFEQFVGPLLLKVQGLPEQTREQVTVMPARKIASRLGVEEFLRVKLGTVGERIIATPLGRGAGAITTLTEADGIIRIPSQVEGIDAFAPVQAELLRSPEAISQTVVAVGSHDNTLDVLADLVRGAHPVIRFSSSHVGSMGGLMAIRKDACHVAGSHLLDETDGTYNRSYIHKYLPGIPVRQVHLVMRAQGVITAKGNPKNIRGIEDLARADVAFVNRQAGSGTRILLDYRLRELGIDPASINGYDKDEFTHMAVAVAVLSGAADAGLGIYAAARALDLDFIPVVTEQYDLIIPDRYFDSEGVQLLMNVIVSAEFKKRVEALGGYGTERTGMLLDP